MEKLNFSTTINAAKEKVWNILWDDSTYRKWTSAFSEGSHVITDWQQGSKILFLDGKGSGMVSMIAEKRTNEYMSFKHLGIVKDGVEDTTSDEVKNWAGATENYTLNEANGITTLTVDMDSNNDFKNYLLETFPKALQLVKDLSEGKKEQQKITPFLWFNNNAEEAINYYISIFKNSRIINVSRSGADGTGQNGAVVSATFELDGQRFYALNGGPMFQFTEAISFFVDCQTQEEVDELWENLSAGGEKSRCGWLKDKFGLSWQIIPYHLGKFLNDKDPKKSARVMQAMMKMDKIIIEKLEQAYHQEEPQESLQNS